MHPRRADDRTRPARGLALLGAVVLASLAWSCGATQQAPAPVPCGDQSCDPEASYCYGTGGGAERRPDEPAPPATWRCEAFAEDCSADPPDCSCLQPWVDRLARCTVEPGGLVKVWEDAP